LNRNIIPNIKASNNQDLIRFKCFDRDLNADKRKTRNLQDILTILILTNLFNC